MPRQAGPRLDEPQAVTLEGRVRRLMARAAVMKTRAAELATRAAELKARTHELSARAHDLGVQSHELEIRIRGLEGRIGELGIYLEALAEDALLTGGLADGGSPSCVHGQAPERVPETAGPLVAPASR